MEGMRNLLDFRPYEDCAKDIKIAAQCMRHMATTRGGEETWEWKAVDRLDAAIYEYTPAPLWQRRTRWIFDFLATGGGSVDKKWPRE
jgi:hypothetical protein